MPNGIAYYEAMIPRLIGESEQCREQMKFELLEVEQGLERVALPADLVAREA